MFKTTAELILTEVEYGKEKWIAYTQHTLITTNFIKIKG
jgi:hypothetical protein